MSSKDSANQIDQIQRLAHDLTAIILPLGVALSAEKDPDRLLERILVEAKSICNADAGLLFLRTEDDTLQLTIRHSVTVQGLPERASGAEIASPPLRMYDKQTGQANHHNVSTCAALQNQTINVPDVYTAGGFDFSGTKAFDQKHNYHTTSILAIPLKNHVDRVIGVFELINAKDTTGQIVAFDAYRQLVAESLASLATVALNNQRLLTEREDMLAALEARMAELGTIYEIGQTISASVELDKTASYVLSAIKEVIPYQAAELCLYNPSVDKLVLQMSTGNPTPTPDESPQYALDSGYIGRLVSRKQGHLVPDIDTFSDAEFNPNRTWQSVNPKAYLGVPLKNKDNVIGTIELVHGEPDGFDENNLRVLETIAVQASVAIFNAQEVDARERKLKEQIRELRIQIDETKRAAEVDQIVNTDYFQNLQEKAEQIRERKKRKSD